MLNGLHFVEVKIFFVSDSTEIKDPEKGWFPRHCAMEVYDDEDEFLKKLN